MPFEDGVGSENANAMPVFGALEFSSVGLLDKLTV